MPSNGDSSRFVRWDREDEHRPSTLEESCRGIQIDVSNMGRTLEERRGTTSKACQTHRHECGQSSTWQPATPHCESLRARFKSKRVFFAYIIILVLGIIWSAQNTRIIYVNFCDGHNTDGSGVESGIASPTQAEQEMGK